MFFTPSRERVVSRTLGKLHSGVLTESVEFHAPNITEFSKLAKDIYTVAGFTDFDVAVRHEAAHQSAAEMVGAVVNYFIVTLLPPTEDASWGDGVAVVPGINVTFSDKQSILEKAAVVGYPVDPSPSDIAFINELGYDIRSLAQDAMAENTKTGFKIPVPLSYTSIIC